MSINRKTAKTGGADLVVATPERLLTLHHRNAINFQNVSHVIVDEADDVLTRGFMESLQAVLAKCPPISDQPGSLQISFVSATLPGTVCAPSMPGIPVVGIVVVRVTGTPGAREGHLRYELACLAARVIVARHHSLFSVWTWCCRCEPSSAGTGPTPRL